MGLDNPLHLVVLPLWLLIWLGPPWLVAGYARRKGYSFGWFLALELLIDLIVPLALALMVTIIFPVVVASLIAWIIPLTIVLILDDRRVRLHGSPVAPVAGAGYRPGYPGAMPFPQPSTSMQGAPPAGWYPAPDGLTARWWDGRCLDRSSASAQRVPRFPRVARRARSQLLEPPCGQSVL